MPFVCPTDDSLAANDQQIIGCFDGMRVFIPTEVRFCTATSIDRNRNRLPSHAMMQGISRISVLKPILEKSLPGVCYTQFNTISNKECDWMYFLCTRNCLKMKMRIVWSGLFTFAWFGQVCCLERPFLSIHFYVTDHDVMAGFAVVQVSFMMLFPMHRKHLISLAGTGNTIG
jgi:hypothetical protein